MQREIRTRELLKTQKNISENIVVVPIITVVIDSITQYLDEILLPLYCYSLNALKGTISLSSLYNLLQTVNYLNSIGIMHGDICDRNVVVDEDPGSASKDIRLALIDFGEVASSYERDVKAMRELLSWCSNH